MIKKWEYIPEPMKNDEVLKCYNILKKKRMSLITKRLFDIVISFALILVLSPLIALVAVMIKCSSKGEVFFCQNRVTTYGRIFKIIKFRTMVKDAESIGSQVTVNDDPRITKVGKILRKYRFDEVPQLFNILLGDMSFVGTRPEVQKYVDEYTDEMKATLLMPAGVTSLASINFKDEEKLLQDVENVDKVYINYVLPQKMRFNLEYIKDFNFFHDIIIMIKTVIEVAK